MNLIMVVPVSLLLTLLLSFSSAQTLPPNPPTSVAVDPAIVNQQLTVQWATTSNTDTQIESLQIACQGATDCPADVLGLSPSTTSHVFTGLTNGFIYSFTVTAVNSMGNATSDVSLGATPSCGSGVLEFSQSTVSMVESNVIVLTVTRLGGSDGFVQVRLDTLAPKQTYGVGVVKTSETTATANYDFSPLINNQLIFASGVTQQTVQFASLDDDLFEVDEFVDVHLSSPSGGLGSCSPVVGAQSPIKVTIVDNGDASVAFTANEFSGVEGTIIDANATLQSLVDLSSPNTSIYEVAVKYRRVGDPASNAGGSATYDVDFRADTTVGWLTFHGQDTPSEWLDDNRTLSVLSLQDTIGEDNENIVLQVYDPQCYCSLTRVNESRDTTFDTATLNYGLNASFWEVEQTTASAMRACGLNSITGLGAGSPVPKHLQSISTTLPTTPYENSVEQLLDSTTMVIKHATSMNVLNQDVFTLTITTTPESIQDERSTSPFTTGPQAPEFYGVVPVPAITCPVIFLTEQYVRDVEWNAYPANVTYQCQDGYSLEGQNGASLFSACQLNKTWTIPLAELPNCIANASSTTSFASASTGGALIPNNCYNVPPSSPGSFGFVTWTNTTANYTCANSALLFGPAIRTCTENSTWTGEPPLCALSILANSSRMGVSIGAGGARYKSCFLTCAVVVVFVFASFS